MAAIRNARDVLLQAATPRVEPIPIPIDRIDGLTGHLDAIDADIGALGGEVSHLMNTSMDVLIRVNRTALTPSNSATLTVVRKNGATGDAVWSVFAGTATLSGSGDSRTVAGSSVSGTSTTIKVVVGNKEAYITLDKLGALSAANSVNLATQVTGTLASGNISGLGALALLSSVNLSTQVTGSLNGRTQVANLGAFAYADTVAANAIGAGQLAAGVIYAGNITADQVTAGTFTGRSFRTAEAGKRFEIYVTGNDAHGFRLFDSAGVATVWAGVTGFSASTAESLSAAVKAYNSTGPGITTGSGSGSAIVLTPTSAMPVTRPAGGLAYHTTHGFIFCNGSKWQALKPDSWVDVG